MVIKTAPHGKEELLPPFGPAKKSCRNHVHVKKRAMVRYQDHRTFVIDRFHILQTINLHQVVSRDVNPAGAEHTLTRGPEAFPASEVHAMGDPKSETLEGGEGGEFFGSWKKSWSNVQCPMSNVRFICVDGASLDEVLCLRLWALDVGHWTST